MQKFLSKYYQTKFNITLKDQGQGIIIFAMLGWSNITRRDKNHIIISINAEKHLIKSDTPFMIKTLNKLKGNYLNIIKIIFENPIVNIKYSIVKTKAFL